MTTKGVGRMRQITGVQAQQIKKVLENHHLATAIKDLELLADTFTRDARLVSSNDTEQWSLEEYLHYLNESDEGWDMTECQKREVYDIVQGYGNVVTFLEVIRDKTSDLMRGDGILVRESDGKWRIAHYVLSFPVTNHERDKLVQRRRWENCEPVG